MGSFGVPVAITIRIRKRLEEGSRTFKAKSYSHKLVNLSKPRKASGETCREVAAVPARTMPADAFSTAARIFN
jgi:hypothetical protein